MQFRLFLLILLLFIPRPGLAFFNVLDRIQEELSAASRDDERAEVTLADLIATLEQGTASTFIDVGREAWYAQYVTLVAGWGIVSGYADPEGNPLGRFGPGDPVTIAEILKMSLKAAGSDETQCGGFAMHPQAREHWSARYVACAEEKKMRIIRSYPDLDRPARRGEVVAVMHDAFGDDVLPLLSTFSDTVEHEYEADIAYAAVLGVVSGDTDASGEPIGVFRPDAQVNRAEAAKIIVEKLRVMVLLEQEAKATPAPEQSSVRGTAKETKDVGTVHPPLQQQVSSVAHVGSEDAVVTYTDEGYEPSSLGVPVGTTVIFRNESSHAMWTASDVHPSHTLYPRSGIQKCLTPEKTTVFDSCEGTPEGGEWPFQFDEPGSWRYHNHLYPSQGGTVEVK